jgi:hypothetical protein
MTGETDARSLLARRVTSLIELGLLGATLLGALVGLARKLPIFTRFSDAVDFAIFYRSATLVRNGELPYLDASLRQDPGYLYPPFLAVVLSPLTNLSLNTATMIWFVMNLTITLVLVALFARQADLRGWRWLPAALVVILLPATYDNILIGQVNLLIAMCAMAALLVSWRVSRSTAGDVIAGALIALATLIKLWPAALMLSYALRRRRTVLVAFMVVLIGGMLFAMVLGGGAEPTRHFFTVVLPTFTFELRPIIENQSVPAVMTRLTSVTEQVFRVSMVDSVVTLQLAPAVDAPTVGRAISTLARVALVVTMMVMIVRLPRTRADLDLDADFSLIITTVLLASAASWNWYLVMLLVPVAFLLRRGGWSRHVVRLPLLAAALLIVLNRYWVPLTYWARSPWVTILGFVGVAIIWVLVVREIVTAREPAT